MALYDILSNDCMLSPTKKYLQVKGGKKTPHELFDGSEKKTMDLFSAY